MSTQENETKTDEPETTTCREMPTITPDPGGNSDTTQEINNSQNNAIGELMISPKITHFKLFHFKFYINGTRSNSLI